jgi:hypothetical protein
MLDDAMMSQNAEAIIAIGKIYQEATAPLVETRLREAKQTGLAPIIQQTTATRGK